MAAREDIQNREARLARGPRIAHLDRLLAVLEEQSEPADGTWNGLAMLLVDAGLEGDESALDFALDRLQRLAALSIREDGAEVRGRLLGLTDVVQWALERVMPLAAVAELERSSHAHRMLRELAEEAGRSNRALAGALDVDETEVSRTGRQLAEAGLARKRKLGRTNEWSITPRGVQALEVLEGGGISRHQRPHQQLLGA